MKSLKAHFKKLPINSAIFLILFFSLDSTAHAQTTSWGGVCVGPSNLGGIDASEVATIQGLQCLIANIFTVILTIIGLAAFLMFIIASFRWMLSGSNTQGTEKARSTMTYAVVGIVVALSAYAILTILSSFTDIDFMKFVIPSP